jgi:hypothetical protein
MSPTVTEPVVSAQVLTPAGIEIRKEEKPKRLYRVRDTDPDAGSDDREWFEVPSVTTILDALSKPLQWWGMVVGVEGVLRLIQDGYIFQPEDESFVCSYEGREASADEIVQLLTKHKLTVNHDTGATSKGTNVHRALENFANTGVVPDPQFYPEDERGFIQALVAFINDAHPHTIHSELMVASMEDGWAGTLDWVANLDFAGQVVTKTYQKKAEVRSSVSGTWIIDAKTSSEKPGKPKSVYPSYMIQGRAYERGFTECGYGVVDHFGVLRLTNDGRYEIVESDATYDDFLAVLEVHRRLERIKGK